jgi:hypothetical protein
MSTIPEENNDNTINNEPLFVDRTHAATLLAEKTKFMLRIKRDFLLIAREFG